MSSSHTSKSNSKSKSETAVEDSKKVGSVKNGPSDKEILLEHGFYLGRTIGSGGYSKVKFAVTKNKFDRVAVKIIDRRRAPRDYQQYFLHRELDVVKWLKTVHIIRTYDWFEENQKIYQIMEYAEGGDVLEYIRTVSKGPVDEQLAQKWILQTTRAIAFMHTRGVVHRDVKCENLLLDANNNVKLSDFGFSRTINLLHLSQTFCGSAAYAAPEIIRSQPYSPYLSDVWALGVVSYIMVTGYMPFGDNVRNVSKILEAQQRGVHFPSSGPALSKDCKSMIRAMLTMDAGVRLDIQLCLAHEWFFNSAPEVYDRAAVPLIRRIEIDDDEGYAY